MCLWSSEATDTLTLMTTNNVNVCIPLCGAAMYRHKMLCQALQMKVSIKLLWLRSDKLSITMTI